MSPLAECKICGDDEATLTEWKPGMYLCAHCCGPECLQCEKRPAEPRENVCRYCMGDD